MTTDADHDALRTYLNDHLAGSTLGVDHARQIEDMLGEDPAAQTMAGVASEIEADRETLLALMGRLGASKNPVKAATAWVAEKAGRVKFSGATARDRELGIFLALETMSLGVEGKRSLWTSLRAIADDVPELDDAELAELIERAESQRVRLEQLRLQMAGRALVATDPAAVS
jgi:hypothetical protein